MTVEIRLSLFLTSGLCAGLPTVIWALYSLRRHREAGVHVSGFIISLMFSDIVEIICSPFVNTRLLEENPCQNHLPCWLLYSTFAEARLCGLHFHQLVALEVMLSLVYLQHSARFPWSSILSLALLIVVISCNLFTVCYSINLILCVVPVLLAILSSVLAIRVSLLSAGPLGYKHPHVSVLVVALFTLLLYVPCLILSCVNYPVPFYESPWASTAVSIMSLRVVSEPILCVLVSREKCQTPQKHTESQ